MDHLKMVGHSKCIARWCIKPFGLTALPAVQLLIWPRPTSWWCCHNLNLTTMPLLLEELKRTVIASLTMTNSLHFWSSSRYGQVCKVGFDQFCCLDELRKSRVKSIRWLVDQATLNTHISRLVLETQESNWPLSPKNTTSVMWTSADSYYDACCAIMLLLHECILHLFTVYNQSCKYQHKSISLVPDPPEKWKEGLAFWTTFLVTWGGVEWHKECNYCIPHALHDTRSRAGLPRSSHIIMHSAIWFELSDWGAVTRKVAQNTRPSLSHVQGGGLGTRLKKYVKRGLWEGVITFNPPLLRRIQGCSR